MGPWRWLLLPGICAVLLDPGKGRAADWPDTAVTRLEALALIETLNAELLASSSATLTLEKWCRDHALSETTQVLAHRMDAANEPPDAATRSDLQVAAAETVRYRRVELTCGTHVLSVAENWYVPGRLTPAMNQQLDNTQVPFGKVVQPYHPRRENILARLLWQPLPEGWESGHLAPWDSASAHLEMPAGLLEHRAILQTAAHGPIAEVHEIYQRELLDFAEPGVGSAEGRMRETR